MGLTKSGREGRIQDKQEQAMDLQMQIARAQLPYMKAGHKLLPLQTEYKKTAIPKATDMLGELPDFERINFDSPNVQEIEKRLNSNLDSDAYKAASKEFNTSSGNREFGSSYQATRQSNLQSNYEDLRNQNALTALQTGVGLYNNDVNTGIALLNAYSGGGGNAAVPSPKFSGLGKLGGIKAPAGGAGSAMGQFAGQLGSAAAPMIMSGLGKLGGIMAPAGGAIMGGLGSLGGMAAGAGGALMGGLGAAGGALASGGGALVTGVGALL